MHEALLKPWWERYEKADVLREGTILIETT